MRLVIDQGYAATSELAASLGVSEMTIRRDVAILEKDGRLRNVHGGVTIAPETDLGGTEFDERARTNANAKQAIARAALQFLPDNGIVAIDAGTTTAEVAPLLPPDRAFTVISYSLPVMTAAVHLENVELLNLGGVFHRHSLSYAGPMTTRAIGDLSIDTLYLGTSSIRARGLFCGNDFDAVTKRALIDVATKVVLLADSSKFAKTAVVRFCDLERIDAIVVDDGIDDAALAILRQAGIEPTIVTP